MKATVTRDDVAKLAKVSPSVVSYVINNSNYVSEDKRRRVLDAVAQLNYTPNLYAKSLREGNTRHVMLIGDSLDDELFRRLSEKLNAEGYDASLHYSIIDDGAVDRLIAMHSEAVFLTSNSYSTAQLNRIAAAGIPVVLFKSREYGAFDPKIAVVTPDIRESIRTGVNYLCMRGHRRLAYVPPLKYRTRGLEDDDYRTQAFKQALESHGIDPATAGYCVHTQTIQSICGDVFEILATKNPEDRPTALIVGEDHIAIHLLRYILKLGLKVPEDLAIIGWGDSPISEMVTPRLTTLHYDVEAYTDAVTKTILKLIRGERAEEILLPMRLVIRETT